MRNLGLLCMVVSVGGFLITLLCGPILLFNGRGDAAPALFSLLRSSVLFNLPLFAAGFCFDYIGRLIEQLHLMSEQLDRLKQRLEHLEQKIS